MQQRDNFGALALSPRDPNYDPHRAVYDGDNTFAADTGFLAVEGRVIDGLMRSGLALRAGGHAGKFCTWHPPVGTLQTCLCDQCSRWL